MVRFCYGVIVRTTMDISDEAYYMAKTVAHEQKRSLVSIVSERIIGEKKTREPGDDAIGQELGFPTFRCIRRVTSLDVEVLENE